MSIEILLKVRPVKSHEWNYKGKNEYVASCPECRTDVTMKKQTVPWMDRRSSIPESPSVATKITRRIGDIKGVPYGL